MPPARNADYYRTQNARALAHKTASDRLDKMGDQTSALVEIEKAVKIFRETSTVEPLSIKGLAVTLRNMARLLRAEGRGKEAVDAIQESVDIYKVEAEKDPEKINPPYSIALCDLALHVAETFPEQKERALAAGQEAVSVIRQMAAADPKEYNQDLALALNNLANRYNAVADHENAITSITESLALYEKLASANPAEFRFKVADGYFNLSAHLHCAGRNEESLTAIQKATDMHRRLAAVNPAFRKDLSLSLNMLSRSLEEVGRTADSRTALKEARKIDEELAAENPFMSDPRHGESLRDIALTLNGEGTGNQKEDALRAIKEMVQLYTQLFKQDPDTFRPHLDRSLKALKQVML